MKKTSQSYSPPDTVYKYIPPEYAKSILHEGIMRVSSRTGYNDPFEMQYKWEDLTPSNVLSFIKEGVLNISQIERLLALAEENKNAPKSQTDDLSKQMDEFYNLLEKRIRICSFMKHPDSITMWSHYAKNHQGICIGFSPDKLSKQLRTHDRDKDCVQWRPVNYEGNIPLLHPIRIFMKEHHLLLEKIMKIFTTKGKMWTSEKEIRLVLSIPAWSDNPSTWFRLGQEEKDGLFSRLEQDQNEQSFHYVMDAIKFYPDAVTSIHIGCKAEQELVGDLIDMHKKQYSHVHLFQMEQNEKKYEVIGKPI